MTLRIRATMLVMGAAALFVVPGCDEVNDPAHEGFGTFRCTELGGCPDEGSGGLTNPKGNTSFLGEINGQNEFSLNNLSKTGGAANGVTITDIFAERCIDRSGTSGPGQSEINPTVPIGPDGELLPKSTFTRVGDPSTACEVAGLDWVDTYWSIDYGGQFNTTLWIKGMANDLDGTPRYDVWLDSSEVPDPRTGWLPLCDYAWEEEKPWLGFDAYFIPDLTLGTQDTFNSDPDLFFLACVSGSIGKAFLWDYKSFNPQIGSDGHEVAHDAIRAEYCGDGVTYTETGTPIWFQSIFTNDGPDPNAPQSSDWQLEAVWSDDPTEPAICVGTTRLPQNQPPPGNSFPCPAGPPRPVCDPLVHLADPSAVLASWSYFPT